MVRIAARLLPVLSADSLLVTVKTSVQRQPIQHFQARYLYIQSKRGKALKMSSAKQLVDTKIAGKRVMVFSKSYCPYCTKAKKYLKDHIPKELKEEDYEVMEIEDRSDCSEIQAYLRSITGASSVPRVFINGKCIGGGDETEQAHKSGQLSKMLTA